METTAQWEERLKSEAYAKGRHIPHSWDISYDSGDDGCMPTGWYLVGLDKVGLPIVWPQRHEYGAYSTKLEAETALGKHLAAN